MRKGNLQHILPVIRFVKQPATAGDTHTPIAYYYSDGKLGHKQTAHTHTHALTYRT